MEHSTNLRVWKMAFKFHPEAKHLSTASGSVWWLKCVMFDAEQKARVSAVGLLLPRVWWIVEIWEMGLSQCFPWMGSLTLVKSWFSLSLLCLDGWMQTTPKKETNLDQTDNVAIILVIDIYTKALTAACKACINALALMHNCCHSNSSFTGVFVIVNFYSCYNVSISGKSKFFFFLRAHVTTQKKKK